MTAGVPGCRQRESGPPSHRALGVDAAQMGLEAAHAPAAVGAQLQVSVALVGALHQERDGFRLGLRLHVDGAPRQQGGSVPAASNSRNDGSSLGRAPPPPAAFIGTPRPGSADRTLCGCRPLAEAEAPSRGPIGAQFRGRKGGPRPVGAG